MSSDYTAAILDELRAMNRKLETMGKISESQVRAISALAERVQLAIGDVPVPGSITFTVGQEITPAEPPVGSIVHDRDGYEWWRMERGWVMSDEDVGHSWSQVCGYSPLTLIKKGDDGA
jgi:hypothetical protein